MASVTLQALTTLPLASVPVIFFIATRPPAVCQSANAPATRPILDLNSSNRAFFKVSGESVWVVAVMPLDKLMDAPSGVLALCRCFVKSPKVLDALPVPVLVCGFFAMMYSVLTIKLNPSFPEFGFTATSKKAL